MNKIRVVNKYKEPNHIYCGRGSALGNPFIMYKEDERDSVCDKFKAYFYEKIKIKDKAIITQLNFIKEQLQKGDVNLGCFCAPKRCHCDIIKEYLIAECVAKDE